MLTCKNAIDLLSQYLDGGLPARRRKAVETHLSGCPPCLEFIESLRTTRSAVRGLRESALPAEVGRALRAFLDKERHGRRP